jgi:hypothetical protein
MRRSKQSVLFDRLVGNREQRLRDSEPEGVCGLEVDYEFEFGSPLDREVARLLTPENPAGAGSPVRL